MKEREECLQLIDNAIKRNANTPIVLDVLKRLRTKVRLIGKDGGRLNEQKEQHSASSNGNQT